MRIDWSPETGSLDLGTLSRLYAAKMLKPSDVVRAVYRRLDRHDHVWISRVALPEALARAEEIERQGPELPLYGSPFAVKDNIDVAGMATTAACKEFARRPARSATVVYRLIQAGAILVGKTNLDQFATGLVGIRSPYGSVANPFRPPLHRRRLELGLRRGGFHGHGEFRLGTDTAGSGRVPAAFNNIVGLKPTRGLLSCSGVLPACRTLDCVSSWRSRATMPGGSCKPPRDSIGLTRFHDPRAIGSTPLRHGRSPSDSVLPSVRISSSSATRSLPDCSPPRSRCWNR